MKNKILYVVALIMILIPFGCKKAEIIYPTPDNESDFSVPDAQFTGPTVSLSINRLNNIVYVGEEFEVKVALYNMPESLFAASLEITAPGNIQMERCIKNPDYIGTGENTVTVEVVSSQSASYGISYRRSTLPHVATSNVLMKIVCKAVATGEHIGFLTLKPNFRITRKDVPLGPLSFNSSITVNISGVECTVSDEFAR